MTGRARAEGPLAMVALGALGVVFGDIGTSPLYALKSVLQESDATSRTDVPRPP